MVGVGPLNQVWLQLAQVYPLKEQSTRSYNDYHAEADRLLALVSDKSEDEDDAGLGGRGPVRPATADPQLTSARRLRRAYYEISNVRRARALGRGHAGAGMRALACGHMTAPHTGCVGRAVAGGRSPISHRRTCCGRIHTTST